MRVVLLSVLLASSVYAQAKQPRKILNPYFKETSWKVWRDDPSPVQGVTSMKREGKKRVPIEITLSAPPKAKRSYPVWPPKPGGPLVQYRMAAEADPRFSGYWDDVYSSWSWLHGYVRPRWRGVDKSSVTIRDQFPHFVDLKKREMTRCGVNFIHQSTTGMAHTITNAYSTRMTVTYERLYFADLLVCSPSHLSFTDQNPVQSQDLYITHSPTLFNSLGSSNSETMAITKMMLVGGYLPPRTKLLLKRSGLYPAAMLYLWKASLPYDVPYASELRHRVSYKSVGNRKTYPERYSAAGIDKGDICLPFHQYDDLEHMRRMIDLARSMDVAMPEACFEILEAKGGTKRLSLYKSACIVQEKGQDVDLLVSTNKSYDLQGLPITVDWSLLYGNENARLVAGKEKGTWRIHVPWDDSLPEGRSVFALVANNGRFDSNPALLTVYRKKTVIPPNGGGYKDYKFNLSKSNRRPVLLGLQDLWVRPGRKLEVELDAWDPEGSLVRYYKRAGEPGEIVGSLFRFKCPRKSKVKVRELTLLASDHSSGNSYAGKTLRIHIGKPELLAHIDAPRYVGVAPLALTFSAKKSIAPRRGASFSWDVYRPSLKRKPKPVKKRATGTSFSHRFDKPGLYEISLLLSHGKKKDEQTVQVLVLAAKPKDRKPEIVVCGRGVRIADGDETPSAFDGSDFGALRKERMRERSFLLFNAGDAPLRLRSKGRIEVVGPSAKQFWVAEKPSSVIPARGSRRFVLRFRPRGKVEGRVEADVVVHAKDGRSLRFRVAGRR